VSGVVEVDIHDVLEGLNELQARGENLKPVFQALKPVVKLDLRSHFASSTSPTGMWAPRAASSRKKILTRSSYTKRGKVKKRTQRRLDNQLGRLKSAFSYRITRWSLEARSIVPWAGVHQEGGAVGRGARVPARTFAWFSDAVVAQFMRAAKRYILAAWFKNTLQRTELF